jgi:hypothetical protein
LQEVVEVVHLEMEDQVLEQTEELEVEDKEGLLEVVDLLVKQILVVEVEVDLIPLLEVVVEEVV